jgi:hypothetical protein
MARSRSSNDREINPIFILFVFLIVGLFIIDQWIRANWNTIILIFQIISAIIIIGILLYIIYYFNKIKRERNEIERKKNATEREKIEDEIFQKEKKEREAQEREQFVQKQKGLGLVSYIDRHGKEFWVIPDEIEKIKQKDEDERVKESLLFKVTQEIEDFKPTREWKNENNYHIELLGWLRKAFPDIVEYEVQSGASRPDLVIKDIAIEIKGPTDSQALNTLPSKLIRYEPYYSNILIVLLECNFSEQHFEEIQRGIDNHFQNVKIIRK